MVKDAKLERAHVVKEVRATYSAVPGLEEQEAVAEDGDCEFVFGGGLDEDGLAGDDGRGGAEWVFGGGEGDGRVWE